MTFLEDLTNEKDEAVIDIFFSCTGRKRHSLSKPEKKCNILWRKVH